ncbi:16S rRNA (cytosine(1402)-N(4))-methyltransferase RsmH [Schwartzia succinivorans]|jgi:16S rRNA (cytosine1402-N4)-methyltransferase|uniref:Ribosomal RNA small subunit methyltransferase H n=1 Tax=Schwartzia succinivorans DSM 10502 TaxID=1123243 RepID=A0A1M4T756_9FIRM|nr:16S rRNA (cytosine(1402)-N(4))-methyltransferase RsmH [Schwartzia succinivorans]MBQ1470045.1 16S rRNA (cytosine(1402)-N(4))-methyltransferase RsmH [Schwartzia sp. (in: firmicutes)]MBQ1917678.1 16S rRNA (cytosine(1402)-N(4))-methyltransferase RsmH [Schwartzia sp. (in: firmicutes)]MBQ3864042.1 16S rRNA (cytosine(1402)-N(4))-methyltransferase RsmH [Schwartzia sp. (in: firmicutes)]MBQ4151878.1 16S rRNA (cytosine(1402)-N(4))-methyltransferase RsmH [Schwartzia sp. (in: firmicutes)]SHE40363.1 16S 
MEFHHVSVMPEETIRGLLTDLSGIYVDCTLGGAGHSGRIAEQLTENGRIIGIDQDAEAIEAAGRHLAGSRCRVDIVHDNFRNLDAILEAQGAPLVDGVLFDLGVSSHQIDDAERGFSYMQDAPLDMRMDPNGLLTAEDIINDWEEDELNRIFHEYGEERWSKRIAQFIVEARSEKRIETTGELVDIICRAIPKAVRRAAGGHPAKRVFQAVRIAVNDELGILEKSFRAAVKHLKPGGRIAIITFHSLEDRIAKNTLRELARGCICPPELPVCVCNHKPEIKQIGKAVQPGKDEMAENPRSRSAKLRIAEKL